MTESEREEVVGAVPVSYGRMQSRSQMAAKALGTRLGRMRLGGIRPRENRVNNMYPV